MTVKNWTTTNYLEAASLFLGAATLIFGGLSLAEIVEIVIGLATALVAL